MNNNTWDKGRGGGDLSQTGEVSAPAHSRWCTVRKCSEGNTHPTHSCLNGSLHTFAVAAHFTLVYGGKKQTFIEISRFYMTVSVVLSCAGRTHDPDTRLLQLLQWRGVPRRMERRQDRPATLTCPSSIHSATIACMFFNAINTRMHVSHSHVNVTLALDSCNEALAWSED